MALNKLFTCGSPNWDEHLCNLGSHNHNMISPCYSSTSTLYLLAYIDDIILTGNKDIYVVVQQLNSFFALKHLRQLNFFLGIKVCGNVDGLLLSQNKYIQDILYKVRMHDAKPISTPMISGQQL